MPLDALPDQSLRADYDAKPERYFSCARSDFVAALPARPDARVLEIGCGTGSTGALAIARGKAGYYAGVELMPGPAQEARRVLSAVVVGDVERLALPWEPQSFDALILSEVLEHLIDPWTTLARLSELLKPGALVLASSPNVAHWRVVRELLAGRFDLEDQGTFDRTHMRWFTPRTFRTLMEGAGIEVARLEPVTAFGARSRLISRLSGGRLDHLFMTQLCLTGHKR